MQDPRVPVALPDAGAAHEWVETTDRVAQLMKIIDANKEKVQSLLGAARDANGSRGRAPNKLELP